MRKILTALCAIMISGSAFAGQYTNAITGRFKALPAAGARGGDAWAVSTAYNTQGALVTNGTTAWQYMVLRPGTSAATGVGPLSLGEVVDNTVTWFSCLRDIRRGWVVQNVSGGNVTIQIDSTSTNNGDGIVLVAQQFFGQDGIQPVMGRDGSPFDTPASVWQGDIFVISTGCVISITEW